MKPRQDASIQDISNKIKQVYSELVAQGPYVPEHLQKYISVSQVINDEFPLQLPDVHKETSKVIQHASEMPSSNLLASRSSRTRENASRKTPKAKAAKASKQAEALPGKFFKPYNHAQVVSFTEQACIQDRKLEVFRYEIGDGLVEALSAQIENETSRANSLVELTLDQNGLSDAQLARLLQALDTQCSRFHQACQTINISNNDFGHQSAQVLRKFFRFESPENI